MKNVLFLVLVLLCGTLSAQNQETSKSEEKVVVDNEQIKAVEFTSLPQGDVCGKGMHHHAPHLTVVLSDAKVRITPEEGEPQDVEVKSGMSIWFDADTHSVTNIGDQPCKMLLVYLKD